MLCFEDDANIEWKKHKSGPICPTVAPDKKPKKYSDCHNDNKYDDQQDQHRLVGLSFAENDPSLGNDSCIEHNYSAIQSQIHNVKKELSQKIDTLLTNISLLSQQSCEHKEELFLQTMQAKNIKTELQNLEKTIYQSQQNFKPCEKYHIGNCNVPLFLFVCFCFYILHIQFEAHSVTVPVFTF